MDIVIKFNKKELLFEERLIDKGVGIIIKSEDGIRILTYPISKLKKGEVKELVDHLSQRDYWPCKLLHVGVTYVAVHSRTVGPIPHSWYFYFDKFSPSITVWSTLSHEPPSTKNLSIKGDLLKDLSSKELTRFKSLATESIRRTTTFDVDAHRLIEKQ